MSCNNLGLWSYSGTSPVGLCDDSLSLAIYGNSIEFNTVLYNAPGCTAPNYLLDGYYSNGNITFQYDGGLNKILGFTGCSCPDYYCVDNTTLYDDTYSLSGSYDGDVFYSGLSSNYVIYYSSGSTQWCLSNSLGGVCLLFGPTGSLSSCPDLDASLFSQGICPTTTTTTDPCSTFDFEAIFDCLISPTPTPTPTFTPTPTPTPTPSTSDQCGGFVADVGGLKKTPLPFSSPTPTPTLTPDVTRPCHFSGSVTFNAFNQIMTCANSKKFKDCFTGIDFYSTQNLFDESGNTLTQGMVYSTYINGVAICAIFEGLVENISGVDNIQIVNTISLFNNGGCVNCTPETPDPVLECIVVNCECGNINVNPSGFVNGKLSYNWVFPVVPQYSYEIYWDSLNDRWVCREVTTNLVGCYLNIDSELPIGSNLDWVFLNTNNSSTDCIEQTTGFFTSVLSTPCPSPSPTLTPTPTVTPCVKYSYPISNSGPVDITVFYATCDKGIKSQVLLRGTSQYLCSSIIPYSTNPQDLYVGSPGNPC